MDLNGVIKRTKMNKYYINNYVMSLKVVKKSEEQLKMQ